jgi:hypothetical protein
MDEEPLQLDRAEYADAQPSGNSCAVCRRAIPDSYYTVNGRVLCGACCTAFQRSRIEGAGVRVAAALAFGACGVVAGTALWYAVAALFHMQLGLIAIVVGVLVGAGVRRGSRGRGGIGYQLMAVLLTYASVAASNFIFIARTNLPGMSLFEQIGYAVAAPFLQGASNLLGLLIIGFALWEAWKLNKEVAVVITGPHRISSALQSP